MLECEIEIGKEEQDALLEITLNSKEYRKKRKAEAIKFSILIVACILIIIWRVTNSDTRLVVLCSLLAAYSLFYDMRRKQADAEDGIKEICYSNG